MEPLSSNNEQTAGAPRLQVVEAPRDELQARVEALLEQERQRWAFEIHDGLTQAVAAAILQVELLSKRVKTDPQTAADDLDDAATQLRASMADVRSMLFSLSESTSEEPPSLQIETCIDEVAGRWDMDVSLHVEGDLLRVPPATLSVAKTVIHEALTNAAKHAGGSVTVTVDVLGPQLIASIRDNGPGLGESQRRFGMRMMERRVAELGGDLVATSEPDGTRIVARLPLGV